MLYRLEWIFCAMGVLGNVPPIHVDVVHERLVLKPAQLIDLKYEFSFFFLLYPINRRILNLLKKFVLITKYRSVTIRSLIRIAVFTGGRVKKKRIQSLRAIVLLNIIRMRRYVTSCPLGGRYLKSSFIIYAQNIYIYI